MKKIALLLLCLPNVLLSQELLSKFMDLKAELQYIDSLKQPIKSISVSPSGNWVVIYGDYGYSFNELPPRAKQYLIKNNKEQAKIKDFDFLLSDSSWVCLTKNNAYATERIPKKLGETLKSLNNRQEQIFQIVYLDKRWAVVYAKGKIASSGFSTTAEKKINELQQNNRLLKHISLKSPDGYLFLYGKNEFWAENIPTECTNQLETLRKSDKEINLVYFYNNAWIIVYEKHKFFCNF